jgi:hypothetical protein
MSGKVTNYVNITCIKSIKPGKKTSFRVNNRFDSR